MLVPSHLDPFGMEKQLWAPSNDRAYDLKGWANTPKKDISSAYSHNLMFSVTTTAPGQLHHKRPVQHVHVCRCHSNLPSKIVKAWDRNSSPGTPSFFSWRPPSLTFGRANSHSLTFLLFGFNMLQWALHVPGGWKQKHYIICKVQRENLWATKLEIFHLTSSQVRSGYKLNDWSTSCFPFGLLKSVCTLRHLLLLFFLPFPLWSSLHFDLRRNKNIFYNTENVLSPAASSFLDFHTYLNNRRCQTRLLLGKVII